MLEGGFPKSSHMHNKENYLQSVGVEFRLRIKSSTKVETINFEIRDGGNYVGKEKTVMGFVQFRRYMLYIIVCFQHFIWGSTPG